jgi:hypothetical protein
MLVKLLILLLNYELWRTIPAKTRNGTPRDICFLVVHLLADKPDAWSG